MKKDDDKITAELTAEKFPYSKENEEMVTRNFWTKTKSSQARSHLLKMLLRCIIAQSMQRPLYGQKELPSERWLISSPRLMRYPMRFSALDLQMMQRSLQQALKRYLVR